MPTAPTLLVTGYKGLRFAQDLAARGVKPRRVVSYRQRGDASHSFDALAAYCNQACITLEETKHPNLSEDTIAFLVGWQFLLKDHLDRCVVFHDSELPKLRGFSPTITALLTGANELHVTAIQPADGVDTGPVYGAIKRPAAADITLRDLIETQAEMMTDLSIELLKRLDAGTLRAAAQPDRGDTYSLWRDHMDYFVDWRKAAPDIVRHIRLSGFPYEGAKGVLEGMMLTIEAAQEGPDLDFANRDPGKFWQIKDGRPLVVCGTGTIWIDSAKTADGQPYAFKKVRARFLTSDTAWIHQALQKTENTPQ